MDTNIGQVGLIEVIRERLYLPCRISRDLSAKVRDGPVYVRHGSHVAIADQTETTDLEEEARRAATQKLGAVGGPDGPPAGWLAPLADVAAPR